MSKERRYWARSTMGTDTPNKFMMQFLPLVDKYLPSHASKAIKDVANKGMSEYENIRETVTDKHNGMKGGLEHIVGHLKKHQIKVYIFP